MTQAIVEIKKEINSPFMAAQLKMALPAHIPVERFQRVAQTALINAPDLGNCSKGSVLSSLIKCAQDGLVPDNKEAAIVKFGDKAQYMPMVYGLIKRMRNSGEISRINAHIVYKHDEFDYAIENGEEKLTHKPKWNGERGEPVLAYAIANLKDGGIHIEIMSKEEIEKARAASRAKDSPAWKNWWTEMAKKTVIHRLAKRVPTSADVEKFMREDMRMTLSPDTPEAEAEPQKTNIIDNLNSEIIDVPQDENGSAQDCEYCNGDGVVVDQTTGEEIDCHACKPKAKGN